MFIAVYFLTERGVRSVAGRGAKAAGSAAVLAGLQARSEQVVLMPWPEVTRIRPKPARGFVLARGG